MISSPSFFGTHPGVPPPELYPGRGARPHAASGRRWQRRLLLLSAHQPADAAPERHRIVAEGEGNSAGVHQRGEWVRGAGGWGREELGGEGLGERATVQASTSTVRGEGGALRTAAHPFTAPHALVPRPIPPSCLHPFPPPQVDEVLAQASAVSQNLADQRRLFDTIGDKVCV